MRRAVLTALDRIDPDLGAFISVSPDEALREAAVAPAGKRLFGTVIAVKDLIDTSNLRTTYGSSFFVDHVPKRTAPIVGALRAHGAVVIGKTNLSEFAYGGNGFNPFYGLALNPKDRTRTTGGSSSGSAAAVAAGVCRLALGTDTSGSVRIPAACCGVYGLKLAHGAAPMEGVYPLAPSFDCIGYLAAGVEDLQRALGIRTLPDVDTVRVGYLDRDISVPALPAGHWTVFRNEVLDVHARRFARHPEGFGLELRRLLTKGTVPPGDAQNSLTRWRRRFEDATRNTDVLVGPLLEGESPSHEDAITAYEKGHSQLRDRLLRNTATYNSLGWPALGVPTPEGSLQVAGRPGTEAAILAVGRSLGLAGNLTQVIP